MNTTQPENTKLAVGYVRSATVEQSHSQIQEQIEDIKKYAAKNGYTIVCIFKDEGQSGVTLIRPAMDQMRLDARKGEWSTVIVTDRDRLSRKHFSMFAY